MSYEYSFADNNEYGAEDINAIVASLVSAGVADVFADGVPYNARVVNNIIKTVYSDGVVPDSVNALKVSKISNGVISIAPGLAFFENGSSIRITEAERLSYTEGQKNYVYLKQDLAEQNRNYPVCSREAPSGDFVLLAEVINGSIQDKRKYARGKVPGYQSNANCAMEINAAFAINPKTQGTIGSKSMNFDMGTNNYSRVFVIVQRQDGQNAQMGMYSFSDGKYLGVYVAGTYKGVTTDKIVIGDSYTCREPFCNLKFSVNGNKLTLTYEWNIDTSYGEKNYQLKMILC